MSQIRNNIEGTQYTQMENGDHYTYNEGSMRPYRCLFCDRCYKYEICLTRHFNEMHLKFFQLCQQQMQAVEKSIKKYDDMKTHSIRSTCEPIRTSVIVENNCYNAAY